MPRLLVATLFLLTVALPLCSNARVLWSDLAPRLVHENADGTNLLNAPLKRDDFHNEQLDPAASRDWQFTRPAGGIA